MSGKKNKKYGTTNVLAGVYLRPDLEFERKKNLQNARQYVYVS